ncbi:MAG TPA: IPT/TIG domain-containing protein, partial [Thermoanaerobaculia bacterium]|nr:IPT/TIG domain-containing protein [Thermoanaerobaculia bacterium]
MRNVALALTLIAGSAFAQQPRIDAVSPPQGPIAGGTVVTVSGAGFAGASVLLDRTAVAPLSQSDAEIRLLMPAHDNGYVVIAVSHAGATAYREFLYVPPRLDEVPPGGITTIAGVGRYDHAFGRATEAMIKANGFAFDGAGNAYIADPNGNRVYLVHGDGTIERFAGNGDPDSPSDGEGQAALDVSMSFPHNIALDGAGNVYIPHANYRIRKVGPDGMVHDIAGTGRKGLAADGAQARGSAIGYPGWLAADREDLFVLEDAARIRRIHFADGTISTFMAEGNVSLPGTDDGGLALDTAGNVYVLDAGNGRIRKIDRKSGAIETVLAVADARGNPVKLSAFTVDRDGNLYYTPGGYIAKVSPNGVPLAEYGHRNGPTGFSEDGTPAASALFAQINYLAVDPDGNLNFADTSVGRMRRIVAGKIETVAGMRPAIYAENGPAAAAILNTANGSDVDIAPSGELLIADSYNARIRRLDVHGNVTTTAGNGMLDGPADGAPALSTGVVPQAIHADSAGIDVSPFGKLARLDNAGIFHEVTRFHAPSICQYNGDGGLAINANLCQPWDMARDRGRNLFVADTNNNRIRRIDAVTGTITTVAGNGAPPNGFENYGNGKECGDGGPALDACFNTPYGLVFDGDGNLFVSDNWSIIRRIDTAGIITTYAKFPATKLRADAAGSIFGAGLDQVARFDRRGKLTILAGGNGFGFSGDGGSARAAKLYGFGQSQGVAIDRDGNLFFVDAGNQRVR